MSSPVLNDNSNVLIGSQKAGAKLVTVSIGGVTQPLYMIESAGGPQILRTQMDISADGTPYYLIAGKGVGSFECTFLEGPFQACSGNVYSKSIMHSIDWLSQNIKNRRIIITTDTSKPLTGRATTKSKSIFRGVIQNIVQSIQSHGEGSVIIASKINAIGQWGNK